MNNVFKIRRSTTCLVNLALALAWPTAAMAGTWTNDEDFTIFFLGGQEAHSPVNPTGGRVISDVNVSLTVETTFPTMDIVLSNGTVDVRLSSFSGGDGTGASGTYILGDEFADVIGASPAGSYRPENPLSAFNGLTEDGTWTLSMVGVCCPQSPSYLYSWSLILSVEPIDQNYVSAVIADILTGDVRQLVGTLNDRMTASWGGGMQPAADVSNPFEASSGETSGGLWARVNAAHAEGEGGVANLGIPGSASYDENSSFFQGGGSFTIMNSAERRLIGSVFGHYLSSDSDISGGGGPVGNLSTKGYGAGGSLTWLWSNGFYSDSTALVVAHDLDVRTTGGDSGGTDALTLATSSELGFRFDLGGGFNLVPQVQSVYQRLSIDGFTDSGGATYDFDGNESLEGRIGADLEFKSPSATDQEIKFNLGANFVHEFLDGGESILDGTAQQFGGSDGSSLMLAAGFSIMPLGDGMRFGVHGNYVMPLQNDGRESYGASASIGWVW